MLLDRRLKDLVNHHRIIHIDLMDAQFLCLGPYRSQIINIAAGMLF